MVAFCAAILTALALTVLAAPAAQAATSVTVSSPSDWQDAVDLANTGATVDATLAGSTTVTGSHFLTAGTLRVLLKGYDLSLIGMAPGGSGFEIQAGALLSLTGPGDVYIEGADGAIGEVGAFGGHGGPGANGANGSESSPDGEDGQKGLIGGSGDPGGDGGAGGAGLINDGALVIAGAGLSTLGGDGGDAGAGGFGGEGGMGGAGGTAYDPGSDNGRSGDGGDGGTGGAGGNGGAGGGGLMGSGSLVAQIQALLTLDFVDGDGGAAGAGGAGGAGGFPGTWPGPELGGPGDFGAWGPDGTQGAEGVSDGVSGISFLLNGSGLDPFESDAMLATCSGTFLDLAGNLERAGVEFPVRPGYDFVGWAPVTDLAEIEDFEPTMDDVVPSSTELCPGGVGFGFWKAAWVLSASDDLPDPAPEETLAATGAQFGAGGTAGVAILIALAGAALLVPRRRAA